MRFTDSHEWIQLDSEIGTVGITQHAQRELGDVVYVELPAVGKKVQAGEVVAVLESTKAAADIYAPVSGEIVAINQNLNLTTISINQDPQKEGWLFKIKVFDTAELTQLLNSDQYSSMIN